eukprot:1982761-Amphidinium_carterae.1
MFQLLTLLRLTAPRSFAFGLSSLHLKDCVELSKVRMVGLSPPIWAGPSRPKYCVWSSVDVLNRVSEPREEKLLTRSYQRLSDKHDISRIMRMGMCGLQCWGAEGRMAPIRSGLEQMLDESA